MPTLRLAEITGLTSPGFTTPPTGRGWRRTACQLLLAVSLCAPAAAVAGPGPVKVGQPHFDFVLPRIDDRAPVSLSEYRGRKLLLIQFASW